MSIIKSLLSSRGKKAEKEAKQQVHDEAKQEAQKIVDSADIKPSDTTDTTDTENEQPKQAKADNPTPPPSQQVGGREEPKPKQKEVTESNEEKQEVTTSKVVAPTSNDNSTTSNDKQQEVTEPTDTEANKPIHERLGMTEEKYTKMLQYYSPQELEYWYGYNPEKQGNALEMIYKATNKEPTEPNAQDIEKRKRMAAISDSLGLLAQMFSHSRGAIIPRRDMNKDALPQLTKREQEIYDKYNKDKGAYKQGLYKAMGEDFLRGLQERGKGRQGASSMMAAMEAQQANRALKEKELADKKEDRDWQREYKQFQEEARRADKDKDRALRYAELNTRNKNNQDKLEEQKRLNDARIKGYEARAKGKPTTGTGSKTTDPVLIINPTDKYKGKTETNRVTGEQTIAIQADKDLIRFFANKAKEDVDFQDVAENVYNKTNVTGEISWEKEDVVANAYIQWLFNNGTEEEIETMRKAIESFNLTENEQPKVNAPTTTTETTETDATQDEVEQQVEQEEVEDEEIDWSEFEVGEISKEELDSITSSSVL